MKKTLSFALAAMLTLFGTIACYGTGATRVSTSTGGDWGNITTWIGGSVPGKFDSAIITAGATVNVSSNQTVVAITFSNNSASAAVLSVDSGITLTVTSGITNQNSATTNTSALLQGAGTITCTSLTVGGTTTPTPTSSDFFATMTSTISNLNVSGNLTIKALYNSAQSAANQGTFALSSGSMTANSVAFVTVPLFGPTLTLATGNQDGTLTLSAGTPFTFTGGGSSTFAPNGTNATVVYSGTAQTVDPATYQNLTLGGSGTKTTAGVTVNGTLSMQGTATASVAPAYGAAAILEYAGSAAQTSGLELPNGIPNLTINNASGVTLTNSPTVTNTLTLTSGKLATGTKQLTIATNGSIAGGSSTSYVNGNLQKTFNTGSQTFTFQIGDGTSYTPLTLANLSVTTSGSLKAFTTAGNHPQSATSGIDTTRSVNRYWTLTQSNGAFGSYDATFNYPGGDVDAGATAAQFIVSRWTGSAWDPTTTSGIPTTNATSIAGESGFGDFFIGDTTPLTVVWTGGGGANKNWSNGTNWLNGAPPRSVDDVIFNDGGAVATASNINNIVDGSFAGAVGSIIFGNTNNFHTTLINPGASLTCLTNFTVGTETYVSATQAVVATITGPGGALNINVSTNTFWNVRQGVASGVTVAMAPGAPRATLDLSGLATFTTVCRGIDVGVESSSIRRAGGILYLAKSNTISAAGLPSSGTTTGGNPAIYVGHNTQGTNQNPGGSSLYLGITNAIFADYIVIGRGNQTNNLMAFNPGFIASNPAAYFRSFDGVSPVAVWAIGDNSASGSLSVPSSGTNDFTGGKVDALVDMMFVGRGAQNNGSAASSPGIGTLTFNNGTMNVNTLYVGYQNIGANIYSSGIGTVNVNSSNATLVVNTSLELAHATNTTVVSPSGTLNIFGGTVAANTIVAGGGSAILAMTNGTLIVTNTAGTPSAGLASLAVTNSTLQLSIPGIVTNIVVTNLTTGGTTNRFNIALLPVITTYPTQFTLVKYSGSIGGTGFDFGIGSLPAATPAYRGYISNNLVKSTVDLVLTPPPTKLAITSVNGGSSPLVGSPFSVVVQSQDNGGTPRNVVADTAVTLSLNTGGGTLGGTLSGTITAGTSSATISGVTYSKAESGVTLTATRTGGETLTAGNSSTFTVNPGNQTITFPSPGNQTYGVAPITLTATASSGLTVSYSITSGPATVSSNSLTITGVGSVTIQASQPGNANWNAATPVSQIISVAQKTVTGSITASNKTYNATNNATIATRSLSGVINGDAVSLTGGTASFADKNAGNGKTVTATGLSLTGANAGNYVLSSTTAATTANITKAALTVSATGVNRVYDGTTNATVTLSDNRIAGDVLTTSYTGASFANKNVGTGKTVTASGIAISGTDSINYTANTTAGTTADITPAALTVAANNTNRLYGALNPVFTAGYSGFVGGDTAGVLSGSPSLSTTAVSNSPVGTYTISVSQGTLTAANYTFSLTNGTLTVVEAPPTIGMNFTTGPTNGMTLQCAGLKPGGTYHIVASTNLVQWTEIATLQATAGGTISFTDTDIEEYAGRYYRLFGD